LICHAYSKEHTKSKVQLYRYLFPPSASTFNHTLGRQQRAPDWRC
jgi:hypothetical protein